MSHRLSVPRLPVLLLSGLLLCATSACGGGDSDGAKASVQASDDLAAPDAATVPDASTYPCADLSIEDVGDVLSGTYLLREVGSCDYSASDVRGRPNAVVQISDAQDFGSVKDNKGEVKAVAGIGKDAFVAAGTGSGTPGATAYAELRSGQTLSVTLTGGASDLDLVGQAEELLRVAYSKL